MQTDRLAPVFDGCVEIVELLMRSSTVIVKRRRWDDGCFNTSGECFEGLLILLLLIENFAELLILVWGEGTGHLARAIASKSNDHGFSVGLSGPFKSFNPDS